jgi:hypothetical protein
MRLAELERIGRTLEGLARSGTGTVPVLHGASTYDTSPKKGAKVPRISSGTTINVRAPICAG